MTKLDLRKELKHLYAPSAKKVEVVEAPAFQFAMIDGAIEPGSEPGASPAFKAAIEALYGISYTLKFMVKQRKVDPVDYSVMALEALWWIESGEFSIERKDNWCWRAMILQPDLVTAELFAAGVEQLRKKRGRFTGAGPTAPGKLRRRSVHADHAHRPLCNGAGHRCQDGRLRRRARLPQARTAPRDLPGRPAALHAGEAEDNPAPPDREDRRRCHVPSIPAVRNEYGDTRD